MIPTHVEVWIECDRCGVAYGGPGLTDAVHQVAGGVVCRECLRKLTPTLGDHGVTAAREAAASGTTGELALGGA